MNNQKNTYKYKKAENILNNIRDEYELSSEEITFLYNFYVINAIYDNCYKRKDLKKDYGWELKNLKSKIKIVLDVDDIYYKTSHEYSNFELNNLNDNWICILNNDKGNSLLSLLAIIRHFLCHSCFRTIYSTKEEKMILFQTNNKDNVTSRGVIKLDTLFEIANIISKKY